MPDPNAALILHLQRLSTEDGPGIRTTIFFKGCPLHCWWCHNPESIAPFPQVHWVENRCIGCDICLSACPNGALSRLPGGPINIDRDICQGCGVCASECPANAMELLGERVTLDDLTEELFKDHAFFKTSGGGVTASGGEPTLQAAFISKLFAKLQSHSIHTALDTCGACSLRALQEILPHTNLVLFDLKLMDSEGHRRTTGQDNQRILENLLAVAALIRSSESQTRLWIRTPLIPGITNTAPNLREISVFLSDELDGVVDRWELCAFNNLCRDKYRRLGMTWRFDTAPLMTQPELDECETYAKAGAFDPTKIWVTGAVKAENNPEIAFRKEINDP